MPSARTKTEGEACTDGGKYEIKAIPDCHCMTLDRLHHLFIFCSPFLFPSKHTPISTSVKFRL